MAELTSKRRAELVSYCRLDAENDEDMRLLPLYYAAAVGYMAGAGVSEPTEGTARRAMYDLCVSYMVLDAFDRRDLTYIGTVTVDNPSFQRMKNLLKRTEPVSNLDTGSEGAETMGSWVGAGDLRDRGRILILMERMPGVFAWVRDRPVWMQVELDSRKNLFSSVGLGARNAKLTIRTQRLSLYEAIAWGGRALYITSMVVGRDGRTACEAAVVDFTDCTASVEGEISRDARNRPVLGIRRTIRFPAVVTEQYVHYARDESHGVSSAGLVLVVPKAVPTLKAGDLVTLEGAQGGPYDVQTAHLLDPYKNEYEIVRHQDA